MKAIIVGGGIGGTATGIALQQRGIDAVVLEQASAISDVGAGFNFSSNGVRCLDYLGVLKHIRKTGVRIEQAVTRSLQDDSPINIARFGDLVEAAYGYPAFYIHRADMLDGLLKELQPGRLRTGSHVSKIEEAKDGVAVTLENGDVIEGDVLIGADGLKSLVRQWRFGSESPRFLNVVCWRSVFPASRLRTFTPGNFGRMWYGRGRSIVSYPLRGGELYNFVGFVPSTEANAESWNISGDLAAMRASFAESSREASDVINAIDHAYVSGLFFRDPIENWSTARTTLLGDAAHPMPPNAGQGSQMALEDSLTLAGCLARGVSVEAGLKEYAQRRYPRTAKILTLARSNERRMNMADAATIDARNRRIRGLAQIDPINQVSVGWIHGYDVKAALDRPVGVDTNVRESYQFKRPEAKLAAAMWRDALTAEDRAELWLGERAGYERFTANAFPGPANVRVKEVVHGSVKTLEITGERGKAGPLVLHLHGGGFVYGSAKGSVALAARLADAVGGWAIAVDYRLAPEHGFPAALHDVVDAYGAIAASHSEPIIITGECAGGSLAITASAAIAREKFRKPAFIYAVSPLVDLSLSSASVVENNGSDPWLTRENLAWLAGAYLQDASLEDSRLSPLHADLALLPPMLIHAAQHEILCDDARRLAEAAETAGCDVELQIFGDSVHSFVLFDFLPETKEALDAFGAEATRHVHRDRPARAKAG